MSESSKLGQSVCRISDEVVGRARHAYEHRAFDDPEPDPMRRALVASGLGDIREAVQAVLDAFFSDVDVDEDAPPILDNEVYEAIDRLKEAFGA